MDRCTGDCCRQFYLPVSPARLNEIADREPPGAESRFIREMVIYLGECDANPNGEPIWRHGIEGKTDITAHYYTCRHFDTATGDCQVYETRPRMCREYPYGRACAYRGCTLDSARPTGEPDVKVGWMLEAAVAPGQRTRMAVAEQQRARFEHHGRNEDAPPVPSHGRSRGGAPAP